MKLGILSARPCLLLAALCLPPLAAATQEGEGAAATGPATRVRLDAAALDGRFEAAWAAAGVKPAARADDAEWLRRATLVLTGTIPSAEEASAFLADRSGDKRSRKVDELLARPEFGDHFGGEWTRRLIGRGVQRNRFDRDAFEEWLEQQFRDNTPFNRIAREVLTASGTPEQNPAVGFVERWQAEPRDLAGQTSKAFLGVQIECARCHDHKDQQWKQSDFNEFAAHFALTTVRPATKRSEGARPVFEVVEENDRRLGAVARRAIQKRLEDRVKTAKNPEAAARLKERAELRAVDPAPLRSLAEGPLSAPLRAESNVAGPDGGDDAESPKRRERLAAWMTSPGNPYFARSIVNTTFASVYGYGLVHPADDFRSDSSEAIPGMLDALAVEFEASGYDFKSLVKLLVLAKPFHLSCASGAADAREREEKLFARFAARPLSPEQLFDAMARATGIDEAAEARMKALPNAARKPRGKVKPKDGEPQMSNEKTADLYGKLRQQALRRFITTFDDDEQGEGIDFEGTIPQALLMMNSKLVAQSISRGYTVTRALDKGSDRVDWIYLSVLGRKPTAEERAKVTAFTQRSGEGRPACEDVVWVLLNSAEFATLH